MTLQSIRQPKQRKAMSQVFLKSSRPCLLMVEKLIEGGVERVLEIGPGGGELTKYLLEAGLDVTAVEKDDRFYEYLCQSYSQNSQKLTLINRDVLEFDLLGWIGASEKKTAVVGNIPYAISTDIIKLSLESLAKLEFVMLMVQDEFGKRICSELGSKSYGSLSIYTQLRSSTKYEMHVPKGWFKPVPKVDSAIITLASKEANFCPDSLKKAEKICRMAFSHRRKKLSNGLKCVVKNPDAIQSVDLTLRPEKLSPPEFVQLAEEIYNQ